MASTLIAASYWWQDRELIADVPPLTRKIRLKLRGARGRGTNNDAYFDSVSADLLLYGSGLAPRLATWSFQVATSEDYEVYAKWPEAAEHASNAAFAVYHAGGTTVVTRSQRQAGGQWNKLGTFSFDADTDHWVELLDEGDGIAVADAIYVVPAAQTYDSYTWAPTLPSAGSYQVYAKWAPDADRATDAVYGIFHDGGLAEVPVDQRTNGGEWQALGSYSFDPGAAPIVVLPPSSGDSILNSQSSLAVSASAPACGAGGGRQRRSSLPSTKRCVPRGRPERLCFRMRATSSSALPPARKRAQR